MNIAKELQNAFNQDLTDYRPVPFWSWNNELDENELIKQIDQMHETGMGGFIMHARLGLTTKYLGEKWFSCIDACLKKAKELGMNAWVYDENGWPSGFVGGKLLENEAFRARFLEYEIKCDFDESAFAVFVNAQDGYTRVNGAKDGVTEYHTVYLRVSPANTDILNPEVVDAFIQETHEKYYARFQESFGKTLTGFFTDEPQYYRSAVPYTPIAESLFLQRYGTDIKDGLIFLFMHSQQGYQYRLQYYSLLNELYVNNYYKKLYDWCEEHGCKLTGHSVEENSLAGQMIGGAGCMATYEYEHIPAIDCLGRICPTEIGAKQVGSVASQLGIKQVMTETFGCAGNDVTPRELKNIGEFQFFNGVNLMCHHLFPYSMAGQAKHDHPPIFSKHSNWWKGFRGFNDYFTKLGYIVANTEENYDVLVIHPLRSVYLDWVRSEGSNSVSELENAFAKTLEQLHKHGVLYQLADESILARRGRVENGKLIIGKNAYDKIILPSMKTVSATTVELLKAFQGKLLVEEKPTLIDGVKADWSLVSNVTYDELIEKAQVRFYSEDGMVRITARSGEIGDFIFVKNYAHDKPETVRMQGIATRYKALDLENFSLKNITDVYTLPPNGSFILIQDDEKQKEYNTQAARDITSSFAVTDITENYLVCDFVSLSYDGVNFGERAFIHKHFEALLRADYNGKLYVKHVFTVRKKMPLKLIMERGRLFSATVNGREITFGRNDFDFNYCEADITECIREGENEFIYGVEYYQHDGVHFALFDPLATESLRNCLYYDTHIENVYIKGAFVVNGDLSIAPRENLPEITTENYKTGYPFFKGSITLTGNYNYDGEGERTLVLAGRYQTVELDINGKKTDMTLSESKDITQYLKVGGNKIQLTVYSSLRNLFGPHHCKREIEERLGIGPWAFTMRREWGNGIPHVYTESHVSVPFGLDKIEIVTNK